jgi:ketosteroid isomerase-like protein
VPIQPVGAQLMRAAGLIAILFCTALPAMAQAAAAEPNVAAEIAALENAWTEAYRMRDSKALESLLDDSFLFVNSRGQMRTKSDVLLAVKNSPPPTVVFVTESMTTRLHGNVAIVTGIYTGGTKAHPHHGRFMDMWVFKGDRWV